MASFKSSRNLLQSKTEYSRYFSAFRGVDFSSDHTEVNDSRFAYAVNMYKDYRSGQGDAVETIPGFRKVLDSFGGAKIYGIHVGLGRMFVHAGTGLYYVADIDEDNNVTMREEPDVVSRELSDNKSTSFVFEHSLYLLDGENYYRVFLVYSNPQTNTMEELYARGTAAELPEGVVIYADIKPVTEEAYVPTTHIEIDPGAQFDSDPEDSGAGKEHEQRNILQPLYKSTFLADGETKEFKMMYGVQTPLPYLTEIELESYHDASGSETPRFPSDSIGVPPFSVKQYDVELPWAMIDGSVPAGYPNAVVRVWNYGLVELALAPPAPELNDWDAGTKKKDEIIDDYYPNAYPKGYAGIEITVTRDIKAISGIYPTGEGTSIITKCTIATIFDNRIFLSGNPEYPKHIFWSGIVKDTGRPDPSYFGILNYDQEGTGDAPVIAMLPVADTLMVLKRDAEGEGSVFFHTPADTDKNVIPRIYPSAQGLSGVGCLGPCINFRDDPIFLSRFGVEAMGQLSVRYERAIEHRSSLIDAKLINCDLANASIAEWEGYLLVLTEGKIFMADSRQMFTHESGVNQYEWYYLEDIGVYNGQFPEYVYAELGEEDMITAAGEKILEAKAVIDEWGNEQSLIGVLAFGDGEEITSLESEDGTVYYKEIPERDEHGRETGVTHKYYVEPTGAMTGGEFDPAVLLKVIGGDIFFATRDGVLCKFNFDMRDKATGLIPNEYYDFDGRTIFSGVATKMDNCGIPHLTKNTVKRSTVIKTRTFKHSAAKVKVRTNKKTFRQVGRIINGRATFEDLDFLTFTFSTEEKSLFSINEKEKKWVEKQHFIYSDEFRRPFAIHYLAYRYNVAGRYKE